MKAPTAELVETRLREASRLSAPLRPEARLRSKVDLTRSGVTARLKAASDLLALCRALHRAAAATRL
jgi:hypothetical protein